MTLEVFIASQSVPRHWSGWTSYTGGVDFPTFAPETLQCVISGRMGQQVRSLLLSPCYVALDPYGQGPAKAREVT